MIQAQSYVFSTTVNVICETKISINEIFIPSHNICFNCVDQKLNVFFNDKPRNVILYPKYVFNETFLETSKTDERLKNHLDNIKKSERPDETTEIKTIYLSEEFVEKLIVLAELNKKIEKLSSKSLELAKEYLVK